MTKLNEGDSKALMPRDFHHCVYIMAFKPNGALYIGVTSNLKARVHHNRDGSVED